MRKYLLVALSAVCLLLMSDVIFGQAPNLGTAAGFVLFSSNGAVSNTGISQITGNVGTNSGSSTAFGNVNGVMHDNDGASAQCSADLLVAYHQLDTSTAKFFPSNLLGNGDTLIAGVYSTTSATTLNLNLTLNAKGNSNAVFIFKIGGSFSTNPSAKIHLINGAMACNVFWKIEGLVSLAAGTFMRGTIIANNAAININTGDTIEGRALTTNGAITIDGILAYTPIGCGSPSLSGPAAPALLSTECYALFSSNGAVTNSGVSNVTGDVGTNVGSTTGFDALLVKGAIHPIPDGSTATCASDLLVVYNYLNTLPYDIELLYPVQFGNSLVLTPHTYIMKGAAQLTDTVFLNALGNADAVFVIQIQGALSTSTYANVVLMNGAQSKNVYWKIEGAVNINNYSTFRGTIVCNNGAVGALNTGVMLDGRALLTTGALTTTAMTVVTPTTCSIATAPGITLEPVNQTVCAGGSTSFSVTATGTGLSYQWKKGTVNLTDGNNISGSTSATLLINPVSLSDSSSNYNVVVSGTTPPAVISSNVSLMVNSLPAITTEPASQSVTFGGSAKFIVVATGSGLTYQWKKGSAILANGGNISGATSDTLIINPVSLSDTGSSYLVVISGLCTPVVTSTKATLTATSVLGIAYVNAGNSKTAVTIYPNPFTSSLNIIVNDASQLYNRELKIYNLLGKEVLSTIITQQLTTLEIDRLPSGIYFYKVLDNSKSIQSGKLISQP